MPWPAARPGRGGDRPPRTPDPIPRTTPRRSRRRAPVAPHTTHAGTGIPAGIHQVEGPVDRIRPKGAVRCTRHARIGRMLNGLGAGSLRELCFRAECLRAEAGRWKPNTFDLRLLRALDQSEPFRVPLSTDPGRDTTLAPLAVSRESAAVISGDAITAAFVASGVRHVNRMDSRLVMVLRDAAGLQEFPSAAYTPAGKEALTAVTKLVRSAAAYQPWWSRLRPTRRRPATAGSPTIFR